MQNIAGVFALALCDGVDLLDKITRWNRAQKQAYPLRDNNESASCPPAVCSDMQNTIIRMLQLRNIVTVAESDLSESFPQL